jgi:acrylyl-CoA reductase (NADPH)
MKINTFKAIVVSEAHNGKFDINIVNKNFKEIEDNNIIINVKYSSLNYKDALSSQGNRGVTKKFPHTPGIDAAGVIVKSNYPDFKIGDKVLITGYDFGMNTSGGYSQYISVPKEWILKLPENFSLRDSMIYGTAGLTAGLSVYQLIKLGITPDLGNILVTGSTGGVGSLAITILSSLGYTVTALTGKKETKDFLLKLGANEVIFRKDFNINSEKLLLKEKYSGVIDTVGGETLSNAIKSTKYGGVVTCCGNVSSHILSTSIYPFILRGVSLIGIDSVQCSTDIRKKIWNKIAKEWKNSSIENLIQEISMEELVTSLKNFLFEEHKGRMIVNLDK